MRDFALDTSRGLAAAGVSLYAVVHFVLRQFWISVVRGLAAVRETMTGNLKVLPELGQYAAVCFGLAATALLCQSIRERAA